MGVSGKSPVVTRAHPPPPTPAPPPPPSHRRQQPVPLRLAVSSGNLLLPMYRDINLTRRFVNRTSLLHPPPSSRSDASLLRRTSPHRLADLVQTSDRVQSLATVAVIAAIFVTITLGTTAIVAVVCCRRNAVGTLIKRGRSSAAAAARRRRRRRLDECELDDLDVGGGGANDDDDADDTRMFVDDDEEDEDDEDYDDDVRLSSTTTASHATDDDDQTLSSSRFDVSEPKRKSVRPSRSRSRQSRTSLLRSDDDDVDGGGGGGGGGGGLPDDEEVNGGSRSVNSLQRLSNGCSGMAAGHSTDETDCSDDDDDEEEEEVVSASGQVQKERDDGRRSPVGAASRNSSSCFTISRDVLFAVDGRPEQPGEVRVDTEIYPVAM